LTYDGGLKTDAALFDGQTLESQLDPARMREMANRQWEWRDGELIRLDLQELDAP
jgi:hypothetical protein